MAGIGFCQNYQRVADAPPTGLVSGMSALAVLTGRETAGSDLLMIGPNGVTSSNSLNKASE
jgi:hypothetical protein